jgi:hypothetical protein
MISEIVRSSANVNNGGKTRWANFWHGVFLLGVIALDPVDDRLHPARRARRDARVHRPPPRRPSPFAHMLHVGKEQLAIFIVTITVTVVEDLLSASSPASSPRWSSTDQRRPALGAVQGHRRRPPRRRPRHRPPRGHQGRHLQQLPRPQAPSSSASTRPSTSSSTSPRPPRRPQRHAVHARSSPQDFSRATAVAFLVTGLERHVPAVGPPIRRPQAGRLNGRSPGQIRRAAASQGGLQTPPCAHTAGPVRPTSLLRRRRNSPGLERCPSM